MSHYAVFACTILAIGIWPTSLEKVKLQFKHQEESFTTLKTNSKMHQILSIPGQDLNTRANSTVVLTTSVGKRGSDGRLPIHQRIDAFAIQLSLPTGINIEFDSSNPTAQNDNPRLQSIIDTYKARVGPSYTIILDKDNQVIAVEGTEKILERATPEAAELLRGEVRPEIIKKAAEQSFSILPTNPLSKGDTWMRTSSMRIGGGQMTFDSKFEYLGTVNKAGLDLDQIAITASAVTYAMDEDAPTQLRITQSKLKIESSKGTILFDRARGQPVETNSVTHIVGDLTLVFNGMEFPGKMDLTLDSSSSVQR